MAEILIERSCQRFRKELAASDDSSFRSTSLDDVRHAIHQVDRHLAARQSCRNLSRLNPYLDAIERYSKAIDVLSNAVPCLPYIWAPLKFILAAVQDCSHALDKILAAYAEIGAALPRLSMLRDAFANDFDFQQLFAFLYEDIMEFHTRAYKLIRKPVWKIFFLSSWGRFEHRFGALIDNIKANSNLIDQQAVTINILQTLEWRRKSLDDIISRERRQEAEQLQAVKTWLGATENDQDLKLEWLKNGCHPGTMHWITRNHKFRSWMQRGRGNPILWLFGKPGSGKSVLSSKIISFIQSNPKDPVLFFFCDYHTPVYGITAHVLRVFCAQIIRFVPELVQFFYDDYLSKNINPSGNILKDALSQILKNFDFVRIVVDGIDEVPSNEHQTLISELTNLTTSTGDISLFLGDEKEAIEKDIEIIVKMELQDLQDSFNPGSRSHLAQERIEQMMKKIIGKAEGMFLWVRLVLSLLTSSGSLQELESNINSLPKELEEVYNKILNNIKARCVQTTLDRVKRIFEWLLVSKDQGHIRKHELLLGTSFCFGCEALDRSSLPLPNALEICKPLIEERHGGTIDFVHSTVSQFLLDFSSGPFTTSLSAQQSIAYACISHLIQTLDFAAGYPETEQTMVVRIGLGIYGLQAYANEHWIEHFLDYVAEANMDHPECDVLVQQASRLAERHSQLSAVEPMALINQANGQSMEKINTRLRSISSIPLVQGLMENILGFRKQLESNQLMGQTAFRAVHHDITLFSFIEERYHQTVQFLLTTNTYPGLSAADLQAFRADYGKAAWVCCFRSCRRSGIGFPSATELQDHQQRQHLAKLECCHPGCTYDIGFSSAKALHDHQKRAHLASRLIRVPATIRRKRPLEETTDRPVPQSVLIGHSAEESVNRQVLKGNWRDKSNSSGLAAAPQIQDPVASQKLSIKTSEATIGRLPAPPPPPPGVEGPPPPPPPKWLSSALQILLQQYPNDSCEGTMRYCAVNAETETPVVPAPPAGQPIPPNIKFMYLPRIRCHDCPGKLYTPGPDTLITNFEVHLKNRLHREKVDQRLGKHTGRSSYTWGATGAYMGDIQSQNMPGRTGSNETPQEPQLEQYLQIKLRQRHRPEELNSLTKEWVEKKEM